MNHCASLVLVHLATAFPLNTHTIGALGSGSASKGKGSNLNILRWLLVEKLTACDAITAARFAQMKLEKSANPDSDSWFHCVTSCEITKVCGKAAARILGNLKEALPGDPIDSAQDQVANAKGREIGAASLFNSCEQECNKAGYSH